jgi:hypothetical protein
MNKQREGSAQPFHAIKTADIFVVGIGEKWALESYSVVVINATF